MLYCLSWGLKRGEGEESSVDQTNTCECYRKIIAIYACEYSAEKPVETNNVCNYKVIYARLQRNQKTTITWMSGIITLWVSVTKYQKNLTKSLAITLIRIAVTNCHSTHWFHQILILGVGRWTTICSNSMATNITKNMCPESLSHFWKQWWKT